MYQGYLNKKQAAAYVGYSERTFSEYLRTYPLPTYGPAGTRYSVADLDDWMTDPESFKLGNTPSASEERILSTQEQLAIVRSAPTYGYMMFDEAAFACQEDPSLPKQ
jgi:hypothetical protein